MNKMVDENDINLWERLGFLEGLEGEEKKECAICFGEMARYLLSKPDNETDETFETVVFPIIRRVITGVGRKDGVEGIRTFIGKFYPKEIEDFYYEHINDCVEEARIQKERLIEKNGVYDEEAASICILSNKIIEKYKGQ